MGGRRWVRGGERTEGGVGMNGGAPILTLIRTSNRGDWKTGGDNQKKS